MSYLDRLYFITYPTVLKVCGYDWLKPEAKRRFVLALVEDDDA